MKKSRRIFNDAKIRNITQGSIFNGGISCLYTHHNVLYVKKLSPLGWLN